MSVTDATDARAPSTIGLVHPLSPLTIMNTGRKVFRSLGFECLERRSALAAIGSPYDVNADRRINLGDVMSVIWQLRTGGTTVLNAPPTVLVDRQADAVAGLALQLPLGALDADGDTLAYTVTVPPSRGTADVSGTGVVFYTPDAAFTGTDALVIGITDGFSTVSARVQFNVLPEGSAAPLPGGTPAPQVPGRDERHRFDVNGDRRIDVADAVDVIRYIRRNGPDVVDTPPLVTGDRQMEVLEGRTSIFNLGASDPDGDLLRYDISFAPQHGAVELSGEGDVFYEAPDGFTGTVSFVIDVSDGYVTVPVRIQMNVVENRPPVVLSDAQLDAVAGGLLTFNLGASDAEGDVLSYDVSFAPLHGTLELSGAGDVFYTPDPGYTGTDAFVILVSAGGDSVAVRRMINVGPA